MPKVIAITSGKGGVGKTNISVNLAVKLARLNHKVCLFDADLGLANINILLGLTPEYTLEDVLSGEKDLKDIILRGSNAIDIIPGSSGVEVMTDPSQTDLDVYIRPLSRMDDYDYIFFDTSAGIARHVIAFCMASDSIILTVIPEPTSFTDSYALLKVLSQNGFQGRIDVVINRCKTTNTAQKIYLKFQETVSKYLKVNLNYLGAVVEDKQVSEAVTGQQPFIEMFPDCASSTCIYDLSSKFLDNMQGDVGMTIESFWTSFARYMKPPSEVKPTVIEKEDMKSPSEVKPTVTKKEEKSQKPEVLTDQKNNLSEDISLPSSNGISEKFLTALNAIVDNTAAITMELSALRKTIEKKEPDYIRAESVEKVLPESVEKVLPESGSPTIQLDFEKFLINKKSAK